MATPIPGTPFMAVDISESSTDPLKPLLIEQLRIALGVLVGPSESVDGNMVVFDGTSGLTVKDSGIKMDVDGSYLEVTANGSTKNARLSS